MLEGRLYIDGTDAYAAYGLYTKYDGLGSLVQWPQFKASSIAVNDWHEQDGIEVDLSAPVLDGRQFQMTLYVSYVRDAEDFLLQMSDGAYHTFRFPRLADSAYTLRLVSGGPLSEFYDTAFGTLTLTFADDTAPVIPHSFSAPTTPLARETGYAIDGVSLANYGILVLKGTRDSFRGAPQVKENLRTSVLSTPGVAYDGRDVRYKSRDCAMLLLIHTGTSEEFARRYNGFFTMLCRPGLRTVSVKGTDHSTLSAYYKDCSVQRLVVTEGGETWCEFTVTLTVTDWSPVSTLLYLAAESDDNVSSERESLIVVRKKL